MTTPAAGPTNAEAIPFTVPFSEVVTGFDEGGLHPLAIVSGERQGELFAILSRDSDLDRGVVRVDKSLEEIKGSASGQAAQNRGGGPHRGVSPATVAAIVADRDAMTEEGHHHPDGPAFCSPGGGYLRKWNFLRRSFYPILGRAGLRFRFHDLRYASTTLLLADGVDVKTVQSRLGHAAPSITLDIYAHAIDRGQQAAAEKMQGFRPAGLATIRLQPVVSLTGGRAKTLSIPVGRAGIEPAT